MTGVIMSEGYKGMFLRQNVWVGSKWWQCPLSLGAPGELALFAPPQVCQCYQGVMVQDASLVFSVFTKMKLELGTSLFSIWLDERFGSMSIKLHL